MSRILFVTSRAYFPWVGACHRSRNALEALAASGYEVDLLTVPLGQQPHLNGVRLVQIPRLPLCGRIPDGPSLRRFALDALMLFKAVFLAGRNDYALIHGVDDCGVVAWIAGTLTQTPCVFECHTAFDAGRVQGPRRLWVGIARFFERMALKRSDAVIGNTPDVIALLARFGRRSRACVIPDIPALPDDVTAPARNLAQARFRSSPDQRLVTCVGADTRLRGLDLFFNAMPHVLAAEPGVRFVVVGGDDREIQRMRKALARAGIEHAVAFTGRVRPGELAALLSISDVLVSPRRAGAAPPVKVLDYLRSGRPIAAIDTPPNRAVLTSENALLTRPEPKALADGILSLCRDPQLGRALARRGQETLERENRTPEAFRDALRTCYDYVMASRSH